MLLVVIAAGGALAVQNVLRGDVKGSRTIPSGGALLTGVEQVLNSAGTVNCRGVWNYTNPQNHPSIDVNVTIGLGTWSITSAAGTVATGTFRVSGGALTATVASLHESATEPASEMPWLAKGSTLVVPGLPRGADTPTVLDAIATYRTTATASYEGGPPITGDAALTTIGLRVESANGTTQIVAGDLNSVGQTITCTKQ